MAGLREPERRDPGEDKEDRGGAAHRGPVVLRGGVGQETAQETGGRVPAIRGLHAARRRYNGRLEISEETSGTSGLSAFLV